jgi:site-specific DNA-methyltransferase (adenine-specific)
MSNTPPLAPDFTLDVPGVFAPSHGSLPTVEITPRVGSGVLGVGGVLDTVRVAECIEFMTALPDACVDAVIADLPYGTTQNAWDTMIDIPAWWEQVRRLCKGAVVMTACQPFTSRMVMSNLEWFKWADVWLKTQAVGFLNARRMPLRIHEDILVFGRGRVTYNPQVFEKPLEHRRKWTGRTAGTCYGGVDGKKLAPDDVSYPRSVVEHANCQENKHPTQKPLSLMRYLVLTYTNPGDVVLDMCCGSGTTLLAAKQEGRHYIGCDREAEYVEISRQRLASEFFMGGGGGSSPKPSTAEKEENGKLTCRPLLGGQV